MQIKFLAAAVSTAVLAVAAHADVTVGGFLQAEVAYNQNQTNQDGKTDFFSGLYDVGSDIRVIGTHQVTETGKLQWEVSTFLTKEEVAPSGLSFLGDRKLYVRYTDSQLGALTVGRDDSPIRMAFVQYDIFNGWASLGTVFDRSSSSRPTYQIKYVSPKMSGLTVRGSVVVASDKGSSEPEQAVYASAAYDLNPMFGFDFGYSDEKDRGQIDGKDRKAWLAGVRGELATGLTYGVAYVSSSSWAKAGAAESENWMVGENLQYVRVITPSAPLTRIRTTPKPTYSCSVMNTLCQKCRWERRKSALRCISKAHTSTTVPIAISCLALNLQRHWAPIPRL
jgi:predicted porin